MVYFAEFCLCTHIQGDPYVPDIGNGLFWSYKSDNVKEIGQCKTKTAFEIGSGSELYKLHL